MHLIFGLQPTEIMFYASDFCGFHGNIVHQHFEVTNNLADKCLLCPRLLK